MTCICQNFSGFPPRALHHRATCPCPLYCLLRGPIFSSSMFRHCQRPSAYLRSFYRLSSRPSRPNSRKNSIPLSGSERQRHPCAGNITGAMVFQSCFPIVFGMLFTEWNLRAPRWCRRLRTAVGACRSCLDQNKKIVEPYVCAWAGCSTAFYFIYLSGEINDALSSQHRP